MALQRAKPGYRVVDGAGGLACVGKRRERGVQRPLAEVGDDLVDQPAHRGPVGDRVQTAASDQLSDLGLDGVDRAHVASVRVAAPCRASTHRIGNPHPRLQPVAALWTAPRR